MKKTKNKILIRTISLMLVAIMLIPANIGAIIASAMVVNGTGEGGGSSTSTTSGNCSIPTPFAPDDNAAMPVAGMRFSVYNVDTEGPNYRHSSKSIDVFKNNKYGFKDSRQKFNVKHNKMELREDYKNPNFTTNTSIDATYYDCYYDCDIGVDLPNTVSGMKKWEIAGEFFGNILNLIDSGKYSLNNGVGDLEYGDRILVEPLFPFTLYGVGYILTPTEIAVLGASMFGRNSTGTGNKEGSNGADGTWNYIANYTNRIFANTMFLSESFLDKNSGSLLDAKPAINRNAQFSHIIENGYGIHIAYTPTNEVAPPPPPPPPSVEMCDIYVNYYLNGDKSKGEEGYFSGNNVALNSEPRYVKSFQVEKGSFFTLMDAYERFEYKDGSFHLENGDTDDTERIMYLSQIETKDDGFGNSGPIYYSRYEAITVNGNMLFTYCYEVEGDKNTVLMADGDM